jgi:hypothetical protein
LGEILREINHLGGISGNFKSSHNEFVYIYYIYIFFGLNTKTENLKEKKSPEALLGPALQEGESLVGPAFSPPLKKPP